MEKLPSSLFERFMKGEHVMRHQEGQWNGIWSDMYIESTFMRYGKGPGGLIGVTLKPSVVKKWANSLHICTQILKDLDEMREKPPNPSQSVHKEETVGRIRSDEEDRASIRTSLQTCVNPLTIDNPLLLNIHSCRYAEDCVNVHNALEIGKQQLIEFEKSLPGGFFNTIKKMVKTMNVGKKSTKVSGTEVYNTELIYARE